MKITLPTNMNTEHEVWPFGVATAVLLLAVYFILPGAPRWTIPAMVVIMLSAVYIYTRTQGCSQTGKALILLACLMLGTGIIANVHYFTVVCGGTDSSPVLFNADASRNWNDALAHLGMGGHASVNKGDYYGYILAIVMYITGPSVMVASLVSMIFLLGTLICCSALCSHIGLSRKEAAVAMGVCMCICYFMSMGTVILKEPFIMFAICLSATGLFKKNLGLVAVLIGAVMVSLVRPGVLGFIVLGLLSTTILRWKQEKRIQLIIKVMVLCAICVGLWSMKFIFNAMPDPASVLNLPGAGRNIPEIHQQHFAYYNIFGDYSVWPMWKRIVMLPVSACVQFMVPFPWNFSRDIIYGYTQVYAHISYPWYYMGAILVYFLFTIKRRSRAVTVLSVWAIVCWLVPCYSFGGTISRYGLFAVPLLAPAVSDVLCNDYRKKNFWIWLAVFTIIMVTVLFSGYMMQTSNTTLSPDIQLPQ